MMVLAMVMMAMVVVVVTSSSLGQNIKGRNLKKEKFIWAPSVSGFSPWSPGLKAEAAG